jgi:hypothetical protein
MDNVQWGAKLRMNTWSENSGMWDMNIKHIIINISNSGYPAHVIMPRLHRIMPHFARPMVAKRSSLCDQTENLNYYLDEFTFRFSRRTSKPMLTLLPSEGTGHRFSPYDK